MLSILNWPMYQKKNLEKSLPKNTKLMEEVKNIILDIVLFGFKTVFGGGRSTGFCFIYDS